jgi:hypothetical protein
MPKIVTVCKATTAISHQIAFAHQMIAPSHVHNRLKPPTGGDIARDLCLTPPGGNGLVSADWMFDQWLKDGIRRRGIDNRAVG